MRITSILAPALLAACASAPDRLSISPPSSGPAEFEIVDQRPPQSRVTRTEGNYEYFGDDRFTVSPVHLLRDTLQSAAGPALKGRRVAVSEFETYVNVARPLAPRQFTNPGVSGNPAADAVAAAVVPRLDFGIKSALADRYACARITVAVDGQDYLGWLCEKVSGSQESMLRKVVMDAISKIATEVNAKHNPG